MALAVLLLVESGASCAQPEAVFLATGKCAPFALRMPVPSSTVVRGSKHWHTWLGIQRRLGKRRALPVVQMDSESG
jgi:hypothetical protein